MKYQSTNTAVFKALTEVYGHTRNNRKYKLYHGYSIHICTRIHYTVLSQNGYQHPVYIKTASRQINCKLHYVHREQNCS